MSRTPPNDRQAEKLFQTPSREVRNDKNRLPAVEFLAIYDRYQFAFLPGDLLPNGIEREDWQSLVPIYIGLDSADVTRTTHFPLTPDQAEAMAEALLKAAAIARNSKV